jgi:polyphenol oxidase
MPELPETSIHRSSKYIEFRLPADGGEAPFFILSTIGAGSMSWKDPAGNERRKKLYTALGIVGPVHALLQQHTRLIHKTSADSAQSPPLQIGDGLVLSRKPGFISVTVADCMPICIWHRKTGELILLHSGWKGTGIFKSALLRYSARERKEDLAVFLGPSIGSCCYEVDRRRYDYFRTSFGEGAVRNKAGRFYLSLLHANLALAAECGVEDTYYYNPCTCCNPDFGSFRRQGPEKFSSMLALFGYFQ